MIDFQTERKALVNNYSGMEIDSGEIDEFVRNSDSCFYTSELFRNNNHQNPLIQPRGGFATFENTYHLYEKFGEVNADIFPLTVDSHTRQNDYGKAQDLLRISEETGENHLNGYPLIAHGYRTTRRLIQPFRKPISLRHGTPDARLLTEIAIAAGIFEIEGGPISYVLPYSKDFPLNRAFFYWNYVEKLCAYYSKLNLPITRESFGPLTSTLVPPAITIVVEILEMLFSVEEGITSFSLGFSQTGSIIQDLAVSRLLRNLPLDYLKRLNLKDVDTHLVYHHWMGAFPNDKIYADSLINLGNLLAMLMKADKVVIKTRDEAFGIPSPESNANAIKQSRYMFQVLQEFSINNDELEKETELIKKEVTEILETILNLKGAALWEKVCLAFREGILDIPFSPHIINRGELISIRNKSGKIRIYNKGNLPLNDHLMTREKEGIEEEKDINLVSRIIDGINYMSNTVS